MSTLPTLDEANIPKWREKSLNVMTLRGCVDVVLSTSDPPGVSAELLMAKRQNAFLLLENSLERAGKQRIITRDLKCNPALLWKKLMDTYSLAPAHASADAAKIRLESIRQGTGPTSWLTYLQTFEEQLDITQDLLVGASRNAMDDATVISCCRDGLNKPHRDLSLSLLDITNWVQWKHTLTQRSFVAKFSGFPSGDPDGSNDRNTPGRGGEAERALVARDGKDFTCYGCGAPGHMIKDCNVRDLASKTCHKCGVAGHLSKACKRGEN
jgi:hypothetical protein